jgi:hypothetical protein
MECGSLETVSKPMKLPYIYDDSNLDKAFGVRKLACALGHKLFICKLLKAAASCRTPNSSANQLLRSAIFETSSLMPPCFGDFLALLAKH